MLYFFIHVFAYPVKGECNSQLVFIFVLQGNPIERDKTYQTDILRCSNVMTLDNIAVRPLPKEQLPSVCKYFILITIIITHLLALMYKMQPSFDVHCN